MGDWNCTNVRSGKDPVLFPIGIWRVSSFCVVGYILKTKGSFKFQKSNYKIHTLFLAIAKLIATLNSVVPTFVDGCVVGWDCFVAFEDFDDCLFDALSADDEYSSYYDFGCLTIVCELLDLSEHDYPIIKQKKPCDSEICDFFIILFTWAWFKLVWMAESELVRRQLSDGGLK
jgi:hypothetical protein